ncbi:MULTISPECIES: TonB-dependent receptor [unclassified Pedobacter]|uniref:TonB-dependent receptor n=1 Tax=unclassified Pedobacter TaxID=2628915 RepID=UPI001D8A28E5|nr:MULTISPECIES: TonB-dependent receptor [unclassified Pedobacter]CAH0232515.1 Ferric-pseudobactin 358 receptor [Pedobacter sp. Bi36]CAH0259295.1 Ferric-pseudobactin 358 receptor [Pedobacter sp. Bi126]
MLKIRLFCITFFLTFTSLLSFAQQFSTISGTVTTSDGKPAAYISVGLKGKGLGNVTNEKGIFEIQRVKPGSYTLRVSAVGIQNIEKPIVITVGEHKTVDFVINQNSNQLNEVNINQGVNKYIAKKSEFVSKMPLNNLENPQVYTTITKETMADQLVFSVDDAARNATGVQKMWESTSRGGDGGAYYASRGFIVQAKLRNGIAGNVTGRNDAANLENVEFIKGPSATLFGSTLTSYGGLINRITKKPFEGMGGAVSFSTGSYDFNRVSTDFNFPVDKDNHIYARLNTSYNYKGSFQENVYDKGFFIAPSLSYKVNDKLDFVFDAEIANGTSTLKPFVFFYFPVKDLGFDRADQSGIAYDKSFTADAMKQKYNSSNFFGQANYKFNENWSSHTSFSSNYSFSNGRGTYLFLVPNNYPPLGNPTAAPGADLISRADQSTDNSKVFTYEVQQNFNGTFNLGSVKNRMVLGLDYLRQNSDQLFYSIDTFDLTNKDGSGANYNNFTEHNLAAFYAALPSVPKYPYNFKTNTYSAYVSDVINLTDRLIALAALRVDRFDNKGNSDRAGSAPKGAYKQTVFSPKFGLVFQPIKDQLSLFTNYQNGFNNLNGIDYQGNAFKPEQANQIEGGIKTNLFNGKLTGSVSYYYIKVKDIVRGYNGDPSNPNAQIQDGNKTSKGIEAEIIANPVNGLNIIAGFAYNDNHLENASPDVEGRRDAYSAAPYSANLWISYKFATGSLKGFGLGAGGNYASDNKIVNSVSQGVFILPAYEVFNASVFYDHHRFRLGVKADNFTNQKYWTGYSTMNPQDLRTFTGSVTYKF